MAGNTGSTGKKPGRTGKSRKAAASAASKQSGRTIKRIVFDADDAEVTAFFAAQGREIPTAMTMLIRMFVKAYGPVSVLDLASDALATRGFAPKVGGRDGSGAPGVPVGRMSDTAVPQPVLFDPMVTAEPVGDVDADTGAGDSDDTDDVPEEQEPDDVSDSDAGDDSGEDAGDGDDPGAFDMGFLMSGPHR